MLEISFGWTSWTSSVLRVRLWKRIWPRPGRSWRLLCQADQLLCPGRPFAAAGTNEPRQALRASSRTASPAQDNRQRVELLRTRCRPIKPGPNGPRQTWRNSRSRRQNLEGDLARQQVQLTQLRAQGGRPNCGWRPVEDLEDTRAQLRQADSAWQAAPSPGPGGTGGVPAPGGWEAEEAWMALRMQEHLGLPGQASWRRWPSTIGAMEGSKPPWRRSAGNLRGLRPGG